MQAELLVRPLTIVARAQVCWMGPVLLATPSEVAVLMPAVDTAKDEAVAIVHRARKAGPQVIHLWAGTTCLAR